MPSRLRSLLVFVTLVLMFNPYGAAPFRSATLFALDRGEITGVVVDEANVPLPGVAVTLEGPERRALVTNDRGIFTARLLLPGRYIVRASLAGFRDESASVDVMAGRMVRVNVTMNVGTLAETVTVTTGAGRRGNAKRAAPLPAPGIASMSGVVVRGALPLAPRQRVAGPMNTEEYDHRDENPFARVTQAPLSTFSIDVDTASYANVRRFVNDGTLPPVGAVRIEELINYFRFDYARPAVGAGPFSITTELAPCPWAPKHSLLLIGLQGRDVSTAAAPPSNLVFLVDVSGSMNDPDKLPLVQRALRMLVERLRPRDRVAIVVYAGSSGLALSSTTGDKRALIETAIDALEPGGSTNGAEGIQLAYRVARQHFIPGGVNRVILATDGDFNVGITNRDELIRLIEQQRESGIYLSVLGVGAGNLKDATMEQLADKGNGNYAYLDSVQEARKVLVREAGGTLVPIANDVKIQVELNPRLVASYRLIGYENRLLRAEDFNDDKKDAGEIGAGHSVTALYEIVPADGDRRDAARDAEREPSTASVDPLKYQRTVARDEAASDELATVKLRYKDPGESEAGTSEARSRLLTLVVRGSDLRPASANLAFASAVAEWGLLLRGSPHARGASYDAVIARARECRGPDADGDREGFIALVERAARLSRAGKRSSDSGEPDAIR